VLRFLAHFHSALIYSLLAAAIAASLLGHAVDAVVILCIVVINAVVGFVQEGRAEQSLNAIRKLIAPSTSVLRDGRRQSVAVENLVRGDVVMLEAGDRVPADLPLLRARGLLIDEAMLTGESVAAIKHDSPVAAGAALGDRHDMAFSGTLVCAGSGIAVVVQTGIATQIGTISSLLQGVARTTTPLLRQIEEFSQRFTWIIMAAAAALFAFAVLARGFAWPDALIAVVALAVGVIPEGLPAVITITLAIGVRRMAARNAVIRKLPAVETLGAISVICSDKTGTLTKNEMTARRVVTDDHVLLASGSGYAPTGELCADGNAHPAALAAAQTLLRCAVLCNDAVLRNADGDWLVDGDPMEGALVALASKAGTDPVQLRADWRRLDEIPFDATHRFMATLHCNAAGEVFAFVKGTPEALFGMASAPLDIDLWKQRIAAAGALGERVLAFGCKRLDPSAARLSFDTLSESVEFLGIIGFIDPPRPEALAAVAECRSAGIAVKMITGDHVATALAIARQLGIADDPQAVTGAELGALSDAVF